MCCASRVFDECGVCSGDSSTCATQASVSVDAAANDVCSAEFAASFAETMATALGVNVSRVDVTGVAAGGEDPCAARRKRSLLQVRGRHR